MPEIKKVVATVWYNKQNMYKLRRNLQSLIIN